MIHPDAKPIAHTSPYRRVDLNARPAPKLSAECADMYVSPVESDRIWSLVRQAAGGEVTPVDLARLCAPL